MLWLVIAACLATTTKAGTQGQYEQGIAARGYVPGAPAFQQKFAPAPAFASPAKSEAQPAEQQTPQNLAATRDRYQAQGAPDANLASPTKVPSPTEAQPAEQQTPQNLAATRDRYQSAPDANLASPTQVPSPTEAQPAEQQTPQNLAATRDRYQARAPEAPQAPQAPHDTRSCAVFQCVAPWIPRPREQYCPLCPPGSRHRSSTFVCPGQQCRREDCCMLPGKSTPVSTMAPAPAAAITTTPAGPFGMKKPSTNAIIEGVVETGAAATALGVGIAMIVKESKNHHHHHHHRHDKAAPAPTDPSASSGWAQKVSAWNNQAAPANLTAVPAMPAKLYESRERAVPFTTTLASSLWGGPGCVAVGLLAMLVLVSGVNAVRQSQARGMEMRETFQPMLTEDVEVVALPRSSDMLVRMPAFLREEIAEFHDEESPDCQREHIEEAPLLMRDL